MRADFVATRRTSHVVGTGRRSVVTSRVGENTRPPRYRLLTAAAALPQRETARPSESFERECPACEQVVVFTQIHGDLGVDYAVEDHDCR